MLEERYFTQQDAQNIAALLTTFFPDVRFDVQYQGIYGKESKLAYSVIFQGKYRVFCMMDIKLLQRGIEDLLEEDATERASSRYWCRWSKMRTYDLYVFCSTGAREMAFHLRNTELRFHSQNRATVLTWGRHWHSRSNGREIFCRQ